MGDIKYPSEVYQRVDPYVASIGDIWVRNRDFTSEFQWQDAVNKLRRRGLILKPMRGPHNYIVSKEGL